MKDFDMIKFTLPVLSLFGFLAVSNLTNTKNTQAMEQINTPIVLEMFTSQSCSSCPPADKLLGKLQSENDNVIALSCNVTYWNHLHWKDTLSQNFCDARQRDYVQNLRSRGPYTPQIVINGNDTMVGNQEGTVRKGIVSATPLKTIKLSHNDNNLTITLPETPGDDSYAIELITYGATHTQDIPSGENRGRKVNYTNPVQNITSLGTWDGTGKVMSYDLSTIDNAENVAVLAHKNGHTGAIIAAGKLKL